MEVYKAVFDGVLRIHPADAEADSALTENLREGVTDDLVPVCSMGDPDTLYATADRFDGDIPGGVVMVRGDEDAERFAVVAETNLAFAETAAHFSRIVSEVRDGVDILEDKTGC